MVVEALEYYKNQLDVRFVSNVEGDHHQEIIKDLNPETTLFAPHAATCKLGVKQWQARNYMKTNTTT